MAASNRFILALALIACLAGSVSALYSPNDGVEVLGQSNFQREVYGSPEVVVAEFFAPWCGHCQRLVPEYKKAAKSLKGLVRTVAVDCNEEVNKPLCGQHGIQGFPTIKVFSPTPDKKDKAKFLKVSSDYQGARTSDGISDFAIGKLPQFLVTRLSASASTLEDFLADQPTLPRAVLVSNRRATPPLWKALSTQYHGRLVLGEARAEGDKVADEAMEAWGVSDFPTVVVYPANSTEFVKYDGEMKHAALTSFFDRYAAPRPSSGGSEKKKKEEERPPFDPKVYEVTTQAELEKQLAVPGISVIAFINLEPEYEESVTAQKEAVEVLAKLKAKYYKRNGPFGSFIWVNPINHGQKLMDDFGVSDMLPSLLIVHDGKKRYRNHRDSFDEPAIDAFLEEVWAGKGRFFKYEAKPELDRAKKVKDEL